MYSVSKIAAAAFAAFLPVACAGQAVLRVCADPNNLPYSNDKQQGFENKLAEMVATDLGMQVSYFWFPQRGAFFRKTLQRGVCDVVMGVPVGLDEADTTAPYYRSTYVIVSRKDENLHITSLDDAQLRTLKIGVQVLGDQDDSLPPVHALVSRGIVKNLTGFSIFGNLSEQDPAADMLRALSDGKIDVAVAWGPLAGFYAKHSRPELVMVPIQRDSLHPDLPFQFDIGIGVRASDPVLKQQLNAELVRRRSEITELLTSYGIPQLGPAGSHPSAAGE